MQIKTKFSPGDVVAIALSANVDHLEDEIEYVFCEINKHARVIWYRLSSGDEVNEEDLTLVRKGENKTEG